MSAELERSVVQALVGLSANFDVMECNPALADTAAFCEHYDIPLDHSANAIMLASKRPPNRFAVCVVLATNRLDVNRTARDAMGVKKLSFASADVTAEVTGMVMGGVTPFGLPDGLDVLVDSTVLERDWVVVGGGSRAVKIKVDPEVFTRMPSVQVIDGLAG